MARLRMLLVPLMLVVAAVDFATPRDADAGQQTDPPKATAAPAKESIVATRLYVAVNDFIVEVYHNGRPVPDQCRHLVSQISIPGTTFEAIEVEISRGDWLVFNVVNNPLRPGIPQFALVAADFEGKLAFSSDERWSYCDDTDQVGQFIAERDLLMGQAVKTKPLPAGGLRLFQEAFSEIQIKPIWGVQRSTWLKFVAN